MYLNFICIEIRVYGFNGSLLYYIDFMMSSRKL